MDIIGVGKLRYVGRRRVQVQQQLFAQCVEKNHLAPKEVWGVDTYKAAEKRFHRAYWLPANRRDLKDLLNRGPSDDKPYSLIENKGKKGPDKDFAISEANLTTQWGVTDAKAAAAWNVVQEEVDALRKTYDASVGCHHVITSNPERRVFAKAFRGTGIEMARGKSFMQLFVSGIELGHTGEGNMCCITKGRDSFC